MSSSRGFSDGRRQGNVQEKPNFVQTCNLLSQYIKEKGSLRDLNLEIGGKVKSLEAIVKPGSSLAASASTNMGKSALNSSQNLAGAESSIITVEDTSNKASTSKDGITTTTHPKPSQLTIFYSGKVLVFDNYPVDKARELVSIAKKSSSQMSCGILSNTLHDKPKNPSGAPALPTGSREGLPPRPQTGSGKQPIDISSNTCKEKRYGGDVASSSKAQDELSLQAEANGSDMPIARRSSLHRFLEKRKDRTGMRGPYQNPERPPSPSPSPSSKEDEQLDLNN